MASPDANTNLNPFAEESTRLSTGHQMILYNLVQYATDCSRRSKPVECRFNRSGDPADPTFQWIDNHPLLPLEAAVRPRVRRFGQSVVCSDLISWYSPMYLNSYLFILLFSLSLPHAAWRDSIVQLIYQRFSISLQSAYVACVLTLQRFPAGSTTRRDLFSSEAKHTSIALSNELKGTHEKKVIRRALRPQ